MAKRKNRQTKTPPNKKAKPHPPASKAPKMTVWSFQKAISAPARPKTKVSCEESETETLTNKSWAVLRTFDCEEVLGNGAFRLVQKMSTSDPESLRNFMTAFNNAKENRSFKGMQTAADCLMIYLAEQGREVNIKDLATVNAEWHRAMNAVQTPPRTTKVTFRPTTPVSPPTVCAPTKNPF
eukprot:TRINITY_DN67769_c13_g2_i2.p2 TRINITY_DN67769_c13_g2~~TRINITY_DN67769_c13_g2_i2.p2  ORF type:complete len:181 (-),score=8.95 TRINITY_DN67769_c13_g2_i2:502-1044(-)